jgi:hypothetical protein
LLAYVLFQYSKTSEVDLITLPTDSKYASTTIIRVVEFSSARGLTPLRTPRISGLKINITEGKC